MRLLARSLTTALILTSAACAGSKPNGTEDDQPQIPPQPPPSTVTPPAPAPVTPRAGLPPAACRFVVPRSVEGKDFYCSDLVVPEDRRRSASSRDRPDAANATNAKTIKLHVIIFGGKPGGTPTIELHGGPGGTSEMLAESLAIKDASLADNFARFREKGDYVLFDQRGTGRSLPRLDCFADVDVPACRVRLEQKGVNIAAYDTIENADDVHALREALGVPNIDLHGISYGSRLGLEVLRRHPTDVRAALIDGILPPDVSLFAEMNANFDAAITYAFRSCEREARCNTAYPNLDRALTDLKTKLETTPFKYPLAPGEETPLTFGWTDYTNMLFSNLYSDGYAGALPASIHDYLTMTQEEFAAPYADQPSPEPSTEPPPSPEDPRLDPLAKELIERLNAQTQEEAIETADASSVADGMYLSIMCNDYVQHLTMADVIAGNQKARPELREEVTAQEMFRECAAWKTRSSEQATRTPVVVASNARVLVVGGEADPITPASWASRVAGHLPSAQLLRVPVGGHGAMDACGTTIKIAFLGNTGTGAVDASCASSRTFASFLYVEEKGKNGEALFVGEKQRQRPQRSAQSAQSYVRRLPGSSLEARPLPPATPSVVRSSLAGQIRRQARPL